MIHVLPTCRPKRNPVRTQVGLAKERNRAKMGAFTFVLHSTLPYCRQAGRWPHGKEWLHKDAAET